MRSACAVVAVLVPVALSGQETPRPVPAPAPPLVVAAGSGIARARAQAATLVLGVESRAPTAAGAAATNARKQNAVLAALVQLGIPRDSISTSSFSVRPEARDGRRSGARLYLVGNLVEVRTSDLDGIGKLIDGALGAGANEVQEVVFRAADSNALMNLALEDAVKAARRNATAMAAALGGRLGDLVEIAAGSEQEIDQEGLVRVAGYAAIRGETPITPREITRSISVVGRWQFVR